MSKTQAKKLLKPALFSAAGAVLGCLYYFLLGDADGDSFLSSGLAISIIYFAVLGTAVSVFLSGMKKSRKPRA
jgi:hypothetical protein